MLKTISTIAVLEFGMDIFRLQRALSLFLGFEYIYIYIYICICMHESAPHPGISFGLEPVRQRLMCLHPLVRLLLFAQPLNLVEVVRLQLYLCFPPQNMLNFTMGSTRHLTPPPPSPELGLHLSESQHQGGAGKLQSSRPEICFQCPPGPKLMHKH